MPDLDYYKVLGIANTASQDDIKKAYRENVRKYHPDLHKDDPTAHKKMSEVNEAYDTLSDPNKRKIYDNKFNQPFFSSFNPKGQNGNSGGNGTAWDFDGEDVRDLFNSFFENGGKYNKQKANSWEHSNFENSYRRTKIVEERGKDIYKKITLSEKDALLGVKKDIKLKRYEKCKHCNGRGQIWYYTGGKKCPICHGSGVEKVERILTVTFPGNLKTGMKVHIANQGNAGRHEKFSGDLYLLVTVKIKAPEKVQDKRITEALLKVKELKKSYTKLKKKFNSKTFLNKVNNFTGPEWLEIGKVYVELTSGSLLNAINELDIKTYRLKTATAFDIDESIEGLTNNINKKLLLLQQCLNFLEKNKIIKKKVI